MQSENDTCAQVSERINQIMLMISNFVRKKTENYGNKFWNDKYIKTNHLSKTLLVC